MFTVPGQANPLAAFAGGAAQQIAQNEQQNSLQRLQQESNRKKSESVLKAFQTHNLSEKSSALDWMKAINDIDDPEAKKTVMDQYETIQKTIESERKSLNDERTEKRERDKLAQARELEELKEKGRNERAEATNASKLNAPKKDVNQKEWLKANDDLFKAEQALQSLDKIDKLGETINSTGYLSTALNPTARAEYKSLSKAVVEPVLKLYNPAGPIPQEKLKWVEETFVASPWDSRWTQKGKNTAMRVIAEQGRDRAKQRIRLLQGDASEQELQKYDQESEQLMDTVTNYEAGKLSQLAKENNDIPEGTIQTNQKTGARRVRKGGQWKPL